jgi:hypothetical protein
VRVYIAAPFSHRFEAELVATQLESRGHTVTHKWWEQEGEYGEISDDFARQCAEHDYQGIVTADLFILLNAALSEGKATELGIAIAFTSPIVAIGKPSRNIFHYWPGVRWYETIGKAIEAEGL